MVGQPLTLVVAILLLAPAPRAQRAPGRLPLTGAPVELGAYDPATQSFVAAPAAPADACGVAFDNTAASGYALQGGEIIVMDWGVLAAGGLNAITSVRFGYVTNMPSPVTINLRLHPFATGSGDAGSPVLVPLAGLPGGDGTYTWFTLDVILNPAVVIGDGPFGWSFQCFDDDWGAQPNIYVTLAGPPNPQGVVDLLDAYDADLNYQSTGDFATFLVSSFLLRLSGCNAPEPWTKLAAGKPGSGGVVPQLGGLGPLTPGSVNSLELSLAEPGAATTLVVGLSACNCPFKGGTLVPAPALYVSGLVVSPEGTHSLPFAWPAGVPAGTPLYFQHWVQDAGASVGLSASNGLQGVGQ
jgi:hypothetical protein